MEQVELYRDTRESIAQACPAYQLVDPHSLPAVSSASGVCVWLHSNFCVCINAQRQTLYVWLVFGATQHETTQNDAFHGLAPSQ